MEETTLIDTYEMTILLSSDLSEIDVQKVLDKVKTSITTKGGNVHKEHSWGKKRLAYPISKTEFGHYQTLVFDAPREAIAETDRDIRLTPEILRHLIISLKKEGITVDQLFTPEKEATQVIVSMKEKTEGTLPHQTRATRKRATAVIKNGTSELVSPEISTSASEKVEEAVEPIVETEEEINKRREELDKRLEELLKEE